MSNFIPLFVIVIIALAISGRFHYKTGRSIALTVLLIVSVEYIFGLFDRLDIGFYLIIIISIFSFIFVIKNFHDLKKGINLNVILLMCIMLLVALIHHRMSFPSSWDELAQWAVTVKYSFQTNTFAAHAGSNAGYADYPPGTALFHYFWMKCGIQWVDRTLYISMYMMLISFLLPILDEIKTKQYLKMALTDLALVLSVMAIYPKAYHTLTVDCIIGVLFAYMLYLVKFDDNVKFRNISLVLAAFSLTTVKKSAIIFVVFALIFWLCSIFCKKEKKSTRRKKEMSTQTVETWSVIIAAIAAAVSKLSWKWYITVQNTHTTFNMDFSVNNILDKFANAPEYRKIGFLNYYKALFNYSVIDNTTQTVFHIGAIVVPAAMVILVLFAWSIIISKVNGNAKEWLYPYGILFVELAIYLVLVSYLYLTSFGEGEVAVLSSMSRYLGSFLVGLFLFLIYATLQIVDYSKVYVPFILIALCLSSVNNLGYTVLGSFNPETVIRNENRLQGLENTQKKASFIQQYIESDETLHIFNGDIAMMNYLITPNHVTSPLWASGEFGHFETFAHKYDYVFLDNVYGTAETPEFKEQYGKYFSNPDEICDGGLYKVFFVNDFPQMRLLTSYEYENAG